MTEDIHVGDIGTQLIGRFREHGEIIDLAEFATIWFTLTRPDGTTCGGPGDVIPPSTDGRAQYLTVEGDLTMAGMWTLQAEVTNGSGQWHTSRGRFVVHED